MTTENDSDFVMHLPCPSCGSSDANSLYTDGHTWCFSCSKYGEDDVVDKADTKPTSGPVGVEGFPAWKSRGPDESSARKWRLGLCEYGGKRFRGFKYGDAWKLRPAQKEGIRWVGTPPDQLYGQDLWGSGAKMVVVTEGELDAISISQVQSHKWPVVSVPNGAAGARKALQKNLEWLQTFETVVLWFDNDDAGQQAVEECAPLFAPGTCKVAKLVDYKDANEALCDGQQKQILDAIWGAAVWRPDGIVAGSDLWEALSRPEEVSSIPYPWEGLQEKTHGLRPTEVVTLTAGSGIGKSAVVRELAHHLVSKQETVGMMMFEETIKRTALGLMSIDMNRNLLMETSPEKLDGFRDAYDNCIGCNRLYLYDHFGSTAIDNVLSRARYMSSALDVRWLFVDHLSILASGVAEGDERRLIDNAMTAIKTLAMETGMGIILVSHLRRPEKKGHEEGATTSLSQLRGSHAIAQLSDIVVGLERDQQSVTARDVTQMRVLKNRFTGETGIAGWLKYDRATGRLHEELSDPRGGHGDLQDPIF